MELISLYTESFRNLAPARVDLHPRLNLIVGANGQGKTNLLEAVALVSGRPSFRTADLAEARQDGAPKSVVTGAVTRGGETETLGVVLSPRGREHYRDGKRIARLLASRMLPAVFLTAGDLTRLTGAPAERRRAVDRVAFLRRPDHAASLARYERARVSKQRVYARAHVDADELAVYEEEMAVAGGAIAAARRQAVRVLGGRLAEEARCLRSPFPALSLELVSDLPPEGDDDALSDALRERQASCRAQERRSGRCLAGPHRDDVVLKSAETPVAARASSGESRTLLLAWTLAEVAVVAAAGGTAPLLLFDDFDSEWDPGVLATFAEALPRDLQLLLTSARPEALHGLAFPEGSLLSMSRGALKHEGPVTAAPRMWRTA